MHGSLGGKQECEGWCDVAQAKVLFLMEMLAIHLRFKRWMKRKKKTNRLAYLRSWKEACSSRIVGVD